MRSNIFTKSLIQLLYYNGAIGRMALCLRSLNLIIMLKEYDLGCVLSAKDILCQEPPRFITIEGLAIEVGLNRTKLQSGFKQVFGLSIYDFQLQKRMEKAKYLLKKTEKSIKEIARLTGYKSTSSFSQAFKKTLGESPLSWRNNGHEEEYSNEN